MTFVRDWRDVAPAAVERLYEQEIARWRRTLGWDTTDSWAAIEAARSTGLAPGWVAFQGGEPCGWIFGHLERRTLQIGGVVADAANTTRRLIGAALTSPEAGLAQDVRCFFWPTNATASTALTRQRFSLARWLYLVAPCAEGRATPAGKYEIRPWRDDDFVPAARLLSAAYAGVPSGELLAPGGTSAGWAQYLRRLMQTTGCGVFVPGWSRVAVTSSGALAGAAIVTRLGEDVAHLAQLVVHPAHQRSGIGAALTDSARTGAAGECRMISLLVEEENRPALALYGERGFGERAAFVSARKRLRQRVVNRGDRAAMVSLTGS